MESPQKIRLRRLNIRLTQQEWDKVHQLYTKTICRSISEYARKLLLNQPVKVLYRNQSFDILEEQMIRLIPQLDDINDNFNRLLAKIDPLNNTPELKTDIEMILLHSENFLKTSGEIKTHIEKLSDQCDPK